MKPSGGYPKNTATSGQFGVLVPRLHAAIRTTVSLMVDVIASINPAWHIVISARAFYQSFL